MIHERDTQAGNFTIHTYSAGTKGSPIVLLHSSGADQECEAGGFLAMWPPGDARPAGEVRASDDRFSIRIESRGAPAFDPTP